jgi:hypothetical protein
MDEVLASPHTEDQHKTEESTNSGVCVEFATLPPDAHIDMVSVARILKRSTKSVQRAVRRGDLPAPFKFLGKLTWTAGVIVEHIREKQRDALQVAARHHARRVKQSESVSSGILPKCPSTSALLKLPSGRCGQG